MQAMLTEVHFSILGEIIPSLPVDLVVSSLINMFITDSSEDKNSVGQLVELRDWYENSDCEFFRGGRLWLNTYRRSCLGLLAVLAWLVSAVWPPSDSAGIEDALLLFSIRTVFQKDLVFTPFKLLLK